MWKEPQQYSKILEGESQSSASSADGFGESTYEKLCLPTYRKSFFLLLGVLVSILSGGILISQLRLRDLASNVYSTTSCGNSTAQARAQGCEFDLLSYSWQPQACLDHETSNEFREWLWDPERLRGAWPFFAERNLTTRVTDEEALSECTYPEMTYATWEEHLGHCVFLERRVFRSMGGAFGVDSHFGTFEHTVHCTNEVLKGIKEDQSENPNWSYFAVYFGTC